MKNVSNLVYLDHAAISPLRPEVRKEVDRVYAEVWGNPSSIHALGRKAKASLDQSRDALMRTLFSGRKGQVVFTSGGTEGNNLVLRGAAYTYSVAQNRGIAGVHVISQPTEHSSVLEVLRELERQGAEVTWLPVDQFGLVNVDDLKRALRPDTAFISVMAANNEIGTIQPIRELAEAAHAIAPGVIFHTDACQAAGWVDLTQLGPVDAITLTGTKFGGPHAGAVWVKRGLKLQGQLTGGGQESGMRSGTEAVPEIAGLALAAQLAVQEREQLTSRLVGWRDQLTHALLKLPHSRLNGHPTHRLPNNVHLSFAQVSGESLLVALDQAGLAASTGSACAAGSIEESHVLRALGLPKKYIHGSLRLTLGWSTTEQDIQTALRIIPKVITDLRSPQ